MGERRSLREVGSENKEPGDGVSLNKNAERISNENFASLRTSKLKAKISAGRESPESAMAIEKELADRTKAEITLAELANAQNTAEYCEFVENIYDPDRNELNAMETVKIMEIEKRKNLKKEQ
jgi:hypothetical protein